MPKMVVAGGCLIFADLLIKCESFEVAWVACMSTLSVVALIKGFPFHCQKQGVLAIIGTHTADVFNMYILAHIGMTFRIHANSCRAVKGSLVFRTVHGVAAVISPFNLSKVEYCDSFHGSWPLHIF